MDRLRGRRSVTLGLVCLAVALGMLLAGGADLVPSTHAEPGEIQHAVSVEPTSVGLPGFADLATAVSPAVVSITTKIERSASGERGSDPFELFFGPRGRRPQQREPERTSGSGFVISADGLIVTNFHVIDEASGLNVALGDRQYEAEVVGKDPATDLALLKIEPVEPLDYLRLADSDTLRVGDWIMVIGSPLQLENSVSVGVVSAKGRAINITPDRSLENFIQTDAAINFGNSGGPLVDLSGAVVGIATAINFGAENIGFAVPVNTLKSILPQLRESGSVRRGYLGVNIADLDYDTAEAFGLESTDGALILQVLPESPSEKAGLEHGDVILEVGKTKIRDNRELIDYIASLPPDEAVDLVLWRNGKKIDKQVTLGERQIEGVVVEVPAREEEETGSETEWLGIRVQELTPQLRSAHSIPDSIKGLWITEVDPSSPLFDENVRPNDFLLEVNGQKVDQVSDFESLVSEIPSGSLARLYVGRWDPRAERMTGFFAVVRVP